MSWTDEEIRELLLEGNEIVQEALVDLEELTLAVNTDDWSFYHRYARTLKQKLNLLDRMTRQ